MCLSLGAGKCMPCSRLGILPRSPRARVVVTSLELADGLVGHCSHAQNRAGHQPRFAMNSSVILPFFSMDFGKIGFFFLVFLRRPKSGVSVSLTRLPHTCLTSLSMEVSFLPRQGLLVLNSLLGSIFPMPDQNACPSSTASSLLCL